MIAGGVRRVHVLAWRDLDDPDAGGSEVHADEFMRRWAAAGLEVTHRTSAAVGQPATADSQRLPRRFAAAVATRCSRAPSVASGSADGWLRRVGRSVERRAVDEPAVVPKAADHLPPSCARADVGPASAATACGCRPGDGGADRAAVLPSDADADAVGRDPRRSARPRLPTGPSGGGQQRCRPDVPTRRRAQRRRRSCSVSADWRR